MRKNQALGRHIAGATFRSLMPAVYALHHKANSYLFLVACGDECKNILAELCHFVFAHWLAAATHFILPSELKTWLGMCSVRQQYSPR